MNYKMMGKFLSQIAALEAVFLIPALVLSLCFGEYNATFGFGIALAVAAAAGGLLYLLCRKAGKSFGIREGMVCCSGAWMLLSLIGCLPFVFSGAIPHFVDALFETVSGFTTTGSSILTEVESLPRSILYWRSFTHWVGGMGVLVFLLAVAPGEGGKGFTLHLLRAESPGPDVGKLVPKMKQTASILYLIYIVLTIVDFLFLLAGAMDPLEAVCTAFGTAGTGGFGVRNDSLVSYSPYIQNVTTVFMLLFGINFSCYYLILIGGIKSVLKDEELRFYLILLVVAIALIACNIYGINQDTDTVEETIRHSSFQVATIISTSGFATTDFDMWPAFSKAILLFLLFTGACAGSTAGGFKCARVLLIFKNLRRNIRQVLHPRKVQSVRINGKAVDERVLDNANAYLAAYVTFLIVGYLVVSLDGMSVGSTFTAVLTCLNNVGPGMEAVGPTCNFAHLSDLSTVTLTITMLAGRLELFPILILFSRTTWRHK